MIAAEGRASEAVAPCHCCRAPQRVRNHSRRHDENFALPAVPAGAAGGAPRQRRRDGFGVELRGDRHRLGCIVGGYLSRGIGSARVAYMQLSASGLCCLVSPLVFLAPVPVFLAFLCSGAWSLPVTRRNSPRSTPRFAPAEARRLGADDRQLHRLLDHDRFDRAACPADRNRWTAICFPDAGAQAGARAGGVAAAGREAGIRSDLSGIAPPRIGMVKRRAPCRAWRSRRPASRPCRQTLCPEGGLHTFESCRARQISPFIRDCTPRYAGRRPLPTASS